MKLIILVFFILFNTILFAQNTTHQLEVDALKVQIHTEKDPGKKLQLLDSLTQSIRNKTELGYDSISRVTIDYAIQLDSFNLASRNNQDLINYYNNVLGQPEEGIVLFNTYFNTLKDHITDRNRAGIYINIGDSFYSTDQPDTAMAYYNKAQTYATKAGNDRLKAIAILYKGHTYTDKRDFANASENLQEASKIFEKLKDTLSIIACKNSLSILYSANGFSTVGEKERQEALVLAKAIKNYGLMVTLYFNASTDNYDLGLQKERINNLHKAVEANKKSEHFHYYNPKLLQSLVIAYAENDSIEKAKLYLKILKEDKRNTEGIYECEYYNACSKLAFAEKDFNTALKWGLNYLDCINVSNQFQNKQLGEAFISRIYEKLNKYDLAYSHLKASKKIEDSLKSVQKNIALSYYQTLHETNKRDRKIKEQNTEIKILNIEHKHKMQLFWGGIIILFALFSIFYLWRSRKYSQETLQLQKVFAQDLIQNLEAERKRISRELHDSVGQSLLLIKNKIFLDNNNNTDSTLVDEAINEVRTISQQLHPFQFEKLGLISSIKNTIENFQKNSNIFYSENIKIETLAISKDKEIFIYRMLQECLNNVEKHSDATACVVGIENLKYSVLFMVKDNGKGFDRTKDGDFLNSLGMKTLKERAQVIDAQLNIDSVKGKGTTIYIKVRKQ